MEKTQITLTTLQTLLRLASIVGFAEGMVAGAALLGKDPRSIQIGSDDSLRVLQHYEHRVHAATAPYVEAALAGQEIDYAEAIEQISAARDLMRRVTT